ncbi:MAG: peptidase T [Clostridia bacterium]|nr:peptidase T [Clostridia bacterium]
MDTSPDFSGENVRPVIHENYDGGDVILGGSASHSDIRKLAADMHDAGVPHGEISLLGGETIPATSREGSEPPIVYTPQASDGGADAASRVLKVSDFPHLAKLRGRTLITTDGTTLLGADDKAGIAEIMTLIERLRDEGIPHGELAICFTPDEEVGSGAKHFDVEKFGAQFAYTVDGSEENEIVYENFNASAALFEIKGFNVHPGSAKNVMINALSVAVEINNMLPSCETPRDTEGYEGFYHLCELTGDVASARMEYIVRDHSAALFDAREETLRHIEKVMNEKYGEGTVKLTLREQYRNMKEQILPHFHLVESAKEVIRAQGLEPDVSPIRGGSDGAMLSYMGLPCPNLGTGGYAFHGPYEHITAEGMDVCVDILLGLTEKYSRPLE